MRRTLLLLLLSCLVIAGAHAADDTFDLTGPKVDVHVKRGAVTLPIGQVANLQPGDRLWVHPDFPESQSAHYVLVVAFLRGATNPPPADWFTRVDTWNRDVREEGVFVTVPKEAQQAVIFLAPETGGDFSTLRNAVRGRPGAFVRAVQDLQAASWDRMRVESYMAEVKITSQTDLRSLKDRAEMSARSLGMKINQACFDKPIEQQASCLSQNPEGMVMDDANEQSLVNQLTSGSTLDLMNQLSSTSLAGGGEFSPYVGAVVDTARILSSLHTAHFQYIPALALPTADTLNLRLNLPPSFRDPKSVVVVALPQVAPSIMPTLHPVNPSDDFCLQKPGLVLPAEGAPLVFATQMAHDLALRINTKNGPTDIPVRADPGLGGLALAHAPPTSAEGELTGVLHGKWGFDDWEGPHYSLFAPEPGKWALADDDESALVVGREDTLHFDGENTVCVDRVDEATGNGSGQRLTWTSPKPDTLAVSVPLKNVAPGPITVQIDQYGLKKPDQLTLKAYAEAASLERMTLNAGDTSAYLKGTRLDEVSKVELEGIGFTPGHLKRVQDSDQLMLNAAGSTAKLDPSKPYFAKVMLRDGRKLNTPVTVLPPRPEISLMSKAVQSEANDAPSPVTLGSTDDLPLSGRLVFFIKSDVPSRFPRDEKVEVAAADGGFETDLTLANGGLLLEDARTAMGSVEPLTRFGASAFGPIQIRAVAADGTAGEWVPLGTLVRMPEFKELRCPRVAAKPCQLTGTDLFLATAIAQTPDFSNPVDVPPDFTGTQLNVPHPTGGALYLRLRDDPATTQTLNMTATLYGPPAAKPAPPPTAPVTAPATPTEEPSTAPAGPATAPAGQPAGTGTVTPQPAPSAPSTGTQTTAPQTQAPAAKPDESAPAKGTTTQPPPTPKAQTNGTSTTGTQTQSPATSPDANAPAAGQAAPAPATPEGKPESSPATGQPQR